jgi:hypothetical protein
VFAVEKEFTAETAEAAEKAQRTTGKTKAEVTASNEASLTSFQSRS